VNYPVARGTPMLASMVKWDHSMEWSVASFSEKVSTCMYLTFHILKYYNFIHEIQGVSKRPLQL
jgi:fatty acid synthase